MALPLRSCWRQCDYGGDTFCYTGQDSDHWLFKGAKKILGKIGLKKLAERAGKDSNHCNQHQPRDQAGWICSRSKEIVCVSPCWYKWMGKREELQRDERLLA